MTKHKPETKVDAIEVDGKKVAVTEATVATDPVAVNTPSGLVKVEKVEQKPVTTAFRFELLAGQHMEGDLARQTGEVVASDDDLVAIHGTNKFRRVE